MGVSRRLMALSLEWVRAHDGQKFHTSRQAREWGVSTRHVNMALTELVAQGKLFRDPNASREKAACFYMDQPDLVRQTLSAQIPAVFGERQGQADRVRQTGSGRSMTGSGRSIDGTVSENRPISGVFSISRAPASPVHAPPHAPGPAVAPVHGIHGSEFRNTNTKIHGVHGVQAREPKAAARPVVPLPWLDPSTPIEMRREHFAIRALSRRAFGQEEREDFRIWHLVEAGYTAAQLADYFREAQARTDLGGLRMKLVRVADLETVARWVRDRQQNSRQLDLAQEAPASSAVAARPAAVPPADAPLRGGPGKGPNTEPDDCEPGQWPAPGPNEYRNRVDRLGRSWSWRLCKPNGRHAWVLNPLSIPELHKTTPRTAPEGVGGPVGRPEGSGAREGGLVAIGAFLGRTLAAAE